jgi:hypothetical protein
MIAQDQLSAMSLRFATIRQPNGWRCAAGRVSTKNEAAPPVAGGGRGTQPPFEDGRRHAGAERRHERLPVDDQYIWLSSMISRPVSTNALLARLAVIHEYLSMRIEFSLSNALILYETR